MFWPKLNNQKIKQRVFDSLSENANYRTENILGLPGTYLDTEIFYDDAPFLKDAPFLSSLISNPNHIGCHTMEGEHECMFKGTQQIEKDLIRVCAEEIFKAAPHSYDGYVASGGTEANIEAIWIARNYFVAEGNADLKEIAIICSSDTHYSIFKAADLLNIDILIVDVEEKKRNLKISKLEDTIIDALASGKKYFIPVLNLGTTMFGSVDDIDKITNLFNLMKLTYKLHVDAAYGGFIYPFTNTENNYNFNNPYISSIALDAHKMLQAPYGTGIFLTRKNMMNYVRTNKASYVMGSDYTLCGSRSGANAVCVWMILHSHGSSGWLFKMSQLMDRANNVCEKLDELGVEYFRNPSLNIITIKSKYISEQLAKQYLLVPDSYEDPKWYKIVIMPHVKQGILDSFIIDLQLEQKHA
jgi:tyrosine decarboxylase/aspartate 1-decarboxylase